MLEDHLACLMARRSKPYAAELKVGRVRVKEYGHVRRCVGIIYLCNAGDRFVVEF